VCVPDVLFGLQTAVLSALGGRFHVIASRSFGVGKSVLGLGSTCMFAACTAGLGQPWHGCLVIRGRVRLSVHDLTAARDCAL